jgi:hypothetical protein
MTVFSQEKSSKPYLHIPVVDLSNNTLRQVVGTRKPGDIKGGSGNIQDRQSLWEKDKQPYILSIRFTMKELDEKFKNLSAKK